MRTVLLLVWAGLLLADCATGPQRKTTFVGRSEGVREQPDLPVGLNPLGSLDICQAEQPLDPEGPRVLISPPAFFSRDATEMVLALREALAQGREARGVELWLAETPLGNADRAQREGRRCGAMLVLWEPHAANTLVLTLSDPAVVPLREQVRERLCTFGSRQQQAQTLYLTIVGLTAMLDNRYDDAVYYVDAANRIDRDCLSLPGVSEPVAPGDANAGATP